MAAVFVLPLAAEDAPWDYDQPPGPTPSSAAPPSLAVDLYRTLVEAYRDNKETTSIHRCLFDVSCSHFAERAITNRGVLVGSILFVDRYFFRENFSAWQYYPKFKDADGDYRLNDSYFLP